MLNSPQTMCAPLKRLRQISSCKGLAIQNSMSNSWAAEVAAERNRK